MERIIEYTADGSATLFVPELDEHYHSVKGALTESSHIFIDMGLKTSAAPSPRILEIGFGTGLNALLTLIEAEKSGRQVHYTGIELYPLPWETVEKLGYTNEERAGEAAGDVDARTIRPPVRYDGKGRNTDYVLRQRSGTEDAAGGRIHRGAASGPSGWQKGNIEGEEDTSHHGGHREHFLFHILKARD